MSSHRTPRAARAAASALAAVLLMWGAAACGGSSTPEAEEPSSSESPSETESEPESSSPSPTEDEEGPDDDAYIDELNAVQSDFITAAGELNLADPKGPKDFQKSLQQLVGSMDTLTADLEAIEPPAEVAEDHQKLITVMKDYRAAIVENVDGLGGSAAEVRKSAQAIGEASTTFQTEFDGTIDAINTTLGRN